MSQASFLRPKFELAAVVAAWARHTPPPVLGPGPVRAAIYYSDTFILGLLILKAARNLNVKGCPNEVESRGSNRLEKNICLGYSPKIITLEQEEAILCVRGLVQLWSLCHFLLTALSSKSPKKVYPENLQFFCVFLNCSEKSWTLK